MIAPIPFVDIRASGPLDLLQQYPQRAENLMLASRRTFGFASEIASKVALPVGDYLSRRWLHKTANPYREEIEQFTRILPVKGLVALNLCYEWGCTSAAYQQKDGITLTRILDWPFPALGENMVVAHQRGPAGDFYNVTWPGLSGIFNAMAPGRFAAALNQAPMRRYRTGIVADWVRNRIRLHRTPGLPPAHLLRKVFETAATYDEAKHMLATEPVSIPVIYSLAGTQSREGCVIERLENIAAIREMVGADCVCAANHFETGLNGIGHGWLPRALDSHGRVEQARAISVDLIDHKFSWFKAPMANSLSRLAMMADAASGTLRVMGTAGTAPVTELFECTA